MSLTNIALNSRSMNGQIVISDGVAVLSEGDLDCQDINSDSLTTNQINTTLLTVTGELRCNLNGPLLIPTSISSLTGLLISYGNVTNSGATDFTNFGSTYTSTQQGFRFFNKSNVQTLTNLAIIDNTQTFFSSPLTGCLAESPVSANSVANRSYVDNNFVDRTNNLAQNINGQKTFTANLICSSEAFFNSWVNLKFRTRIYDISSPQTNYTQMYMIGNNEFIIYPNANGNFISFYCKDATLGQIQTFKSSALGNTSLVKLTCSSSLISNNITAPIVLGGTNNIFTNLDTSTGGANINIGARNNNINVKCNFNINESGYGTGQNTLIWMEGNNSRFENQNSTNGTYIFSIVESGTFNPLVINKTSVDIAGDAVVSGNLILYDTTPSTLSMSVGVLGNNMTFDPENTEDTKYHFKVNDITGTSTTTPLIISTASTTVANTLVCNSQATFNNGATFNSVIPTCSITASSANQLVNYSTLTTQGYTTLSAVQSNGNTFTATNTFTGNLVSTSAIIVRASLAIENGTKQMQSYLTATGELTFQPFFVSNSYKFQCLNATNTADKSLLITFDKTTVQTQLEVAENATFNSTATFTGDVTLSKTKNNSSYATYNALGSTYIGYMAEVPAGGYVGIGSGTQYQLGAITLDSSNVGFWTCNYEVEINCSTAGSISKIYVFVSNNLVSTTVPIGLPGAKANNFSTQTYAVGDSTYHSGSFSFLQSTSTVIYGVQLIAIVSSGGFQRKGQIRMLRIL